LKLPNHTALYGGLILEVPETDAEELKFFIMALKVVHFSVDAHERRLDKLEKKLRGTKEEL
jgi:hypothetical protein